jgi:hypothetical protein
MKRAPFQPITRTDQILTALYEIQDLATRGNVAEIIPLVASVIDVAQGNPGVLATLPHVAQPAPVAAQGGK